MLQWGRCTNAAEIERRPPSPPIVGLLQWGRCTNAAEISPIAVSRYSSNRLQWGRCTNAAEIGRNLHFSFDGDLSFNEAAARTQRKFVYERALRVLNDASMGPLHERSGNLRSCRSAAPSIESFNILRSSMVRSAGVVTWIFPYTATCDVLPMRASTAAESFRWMINRSPSSRTVEPCS